jgi:hypothetical protein
MKNIPYSPSPFLDSKGLIHPDIKSANIVLCGHGGTHDSETGLDFGLLKDIQQGAAQLTHADAIVGTPPLFGARADHRHFGF